MCQKIALDLSVNIFSTKVLTGDTKVSLLAVQFEYLHFSVILRVGNGPAPGIECATPALQSSALLTELILCGQGISVFDHWTFGEDRG